MTDEIKERDEDRDRDRERADTQPGELASHKFAWLEADVEGITWEDNENEDGDGA